ncbi:MAG: RpoL/Rpb11 RNA polymerase subunit family protein [Nitrososphaeraceae archaeon]
MQAEISKIEENNIELKLKDEDISIMYIIQHHLLNDKNIDFAGVVMKHPLLKEFILQVNLKNGKKPITSIESAVIASNSYCDDLIKIIQTI